MTARFTSFLVKVASRCNLDCDYCYVYHHTDQSWRSMPPLLSVGDREGFARRLSAYVADADITRCAVIFHGGEPLLAGASSLVAFANLIRAAVPSGVTVDIGLQTNGLLLTESAVAAFADANMTVSLSLDGPKAANDLHRTSRTGRSSFNRAFAALQLLQRYPTVFAGLIAVIDPRIPPEAHFAFFDQHRPPKLDFLLPDAHHLRAPPGRDDRPSVYRDWLLRAFDIWFDDYPHLPVRTFEALLDALAGLPSGTDSFGFGDVSLLSVETDGSYHDLDVLKVTFHGATRLEGSVRDTDIMTVAASAPIAAHRRLLSKEGLCETCHACPEVSICGGGSVPHRYGADGFDHPTVYCEEFLSLIRHVRSRLTAALAKERAEPSSAVPFSFEHFDYAETAGPAIGYLWAQACAAHRQELVEALNVAQGAGGLTEATVASFQALSPAAFTAIATHPGMIAWQRAAIGSARGRVVHAVDGSQVTVDPRYALEVLRTVENAGEPLLHTAGTADAWLRLPFGSAIAFESEETARAARPVLAEALTIIERWRPALSAELRRISSAVQFVRDPAAHPEKIVSFSDNAVPGALYVSVLQGAVFIDPYDLADSLVHEHRHQKLYLLERVMPLVHSTAVKVKSPWREDLRPPSGLLHAVFVFIELRRFWEYVRDHGPERLRIRAINQLADTERNLAEGFATLADCPLTEHGTKLVATLRSGGRVAAHAAE